MISVPSNIAPHLVLTHPFQGVHGWFDRELLPCNQERLLFWRRTVKWFHTRSNPSWRQCRSELNWSVFNAWTLKDCFGGTHVHLHVTKYWMIIDWTTDRTYWYPQVARNDWQALLPQQSTWSSVASTTCTGGGGHGQDLFHPKQAAWAAPQVRFSLHLISIYIDLWLQMIGVWRNKCRSFLNDTDATIEAEEKMLYKTKLLTQKQWNQVLSNAYPSRSFLPSETWQEISTCQDDARSLLQILGVVLACFARCACTSCLFASNFPLDSQRCGPPEAWLKLWWRTKSKWESNYNKSWVKNA